MAHRRSVKLLRNEAVKPGVRSYDVVFVDDAWAPGTTANIVADPNLNPGDPAQVVIAHGIPVVAGRNHSRWNGTGAAAGTYHGPVVLRHGAVSLGPLLMGCAGRRRPKKPWA